MKVRELTSSPKRRNEKNRPLGDRNPGLCDLFSTLRSRVFRLKPNPPCVRVCSSGSGCPSARRGCWEPPGRLADCFSGFLSRFWLTSVPGCPQA